MLLLYDPICIILLKLKEQKQMQEQLPTASWTASPTVQIPVGFGLFCISR